MAKQIATAKEVQFAVALLKRLHANVNNYYLLNAVIAWMRDASGTTYHGNNPLKIFGGRRYRSLQAAAYATARFLMNHAEYKTLIRRIHEAPRHEAGQKEQALDFFRLLAMSTWDAYHFGVLKAGPYGGFMYDDAPEAQNRNRLLVIINKLLGHRITIPGEPSRPAARMAKPHAPKFGGLHRIARVAYIEPYAARGFYEARHVETPVVPGSPVGVGG